MAKGKTVAELLNEAEELQKTAVPELYKDDTGEEGTSGKEGASGEPATEKDKPASEVAETEEEKKAGKDTEAEAKLTDADKAEIERLRAEIKKLNNYESSARGRLHITAEENRALKASIESLTREIEALKAQTKVAGQDTSELTEEELEDLLGERAGKLLYEVNKKSAQLEKMLGNLNQRVETFGERAAKDEGERFIGDLTASVNDWETIKEDPEFHEFLRKPLTPYSKTTNFDELSKVASALDAKGTARIYQAFKDSKTTTTNNPPIRKDKERLLAPGSAPKGEKTEKTIEHYSLEEIKAMKDKIFEYQKKGNFDAARKIQAKIDAFTDSLG